jgi:spermidine/putrescine transport system ATP-binding protein
LSELAGVRNRKIGFVFQGFNLISRTSALENVELPMIYNHTPAHKRREKAMEALKAVGLEARAHHMPNQLSGGQQQRVAIARALINHPRVLLLDEPLGALDLKLRKDMQTELKKIQRATGITFIYVTHDQEEALSMSDVVVVMSGGHIQQIGSPVDIYNEPVNAFVADFIGESNIVDGFMLADRKVRFSGHTFECLDGGFAKNEPVDVVIRPEDVDIVPADKGMLNGVVSSVTFKGDYYEIIVDVQGFKWMLETSDYAAPDTTIGLFIEPEAIHVMKKSEFSGQFGDYSSFSDEMDHLSDLEEEEEE